MSRSALRTSIAVLTIITAVIHLVILNIPFMRTQGSPDILFTLNGLGYLAFLVAMFVDFPLLGDRPRFVQYAFIVYTLVTIIAWVLIGSRDLLAYLTKLDEVLLVAALWAHLGRTES